MLKLHGFSVSNYYNMVKLALLEKGIPFEAVDVHGGQREEFLRISPRGKVPVLQTEQGFINETSVILEYIEETQSGKALLPSNPQERAYVRSLMREIELYIELPARACYLEAFFGGKVDEAIKAKSKEDLTLGIASLKRHGTFAPYLAGEQLSLADLYFLYSLDLACVVMGKVFATDVLADFPQAKALFKLLSQNPNVQKVAADKDAEMEQFLAMARGAKK
ncbi:glutathione S-transferase family protein [Pseudomonas sp. GV071]|jgi:glutathione S-transferase|uniref:glutathione S-transferase family protein n=1 Tax=Pseudomonas sp. GV071 TaxID=2135754 RepID=UPI000D3B3FFA|nr:glutathione S-transferase [Pseudomonas sp. GV071]PTQ68810.1 glutathione S-transferase [Pseudomonas sp. GV071]